MYKDKTRQIQKARKYRNGVFWNKEKTNIAIQDLNETTRYMAKEYELKKQRININSQDKTHTITAKEKEQKRDLLKTATTEHTVQTKQSTNRSENKEQRVNNITSTRMGKATTGCREQKWVITDQLYYVDQKEHKIQKCNKKSYL